MFEVVCQLVALALALALEPVHLSDQLSQNRPEKSLSFYFLSEPLTLVDHLARHRGVADCCFACKQRRYENN